MLLGRGIVRRFLLEIFPPSLCRREAESWLIQADWRNFETRIWFGSVVVWDIFLFEYINHRKMS